MTDNVPESPAHALRTQLNSIIGFSDLLLASGLDPQQRHHVSLIRQAGERLLSLLAPPPAGETAAPPAAPTAARLAGRCLVIDDVESVRLFISLALKRTGLEVLDSDGRDDLPALIAGFDPDLILLDLHLRDTDGFALLQRILAQPNRRVVPVVATTASAAADLGERIRAAGFHSLLRKPFSLSELYRLVAETLGHPAPPGTAAPSASPAVDEGPSPELRSAWKKLSPAARAEALDIFAAIRRSGSLNRCEELARRLISLGGAENLPPLATWGGRLAERARLCRIGELKRLLDDFARLEDAHG